MHARRAPKASTDDSLKLSSTAYAILGLVRAEPGSAYDLAKRMDITYAYFWPRARSLVFAEAKRLAQFGLVRGEARAAGKRERLVYSITPRGERALRRWLASAPSSFGLEIEALVRVYLADFGTHADLDRSLASVEAEAQGMLRIARTIIPAYLEGRPPPPADDIVTRALLIDFLAGFAVFAHAWAQRSRAEVARWGKQPRSETPARRMLKRLLSELPAESQPGRSQSVSQST